MIFYAISDRKQETSGSLAAQLEKYIRLGVDWIQIREKDLPDGSLFEAAETALRITGGAGIKVLINGRADIASVCGAAGVHLPSDSPPIATVRLSFPRLMVIKSCHKIEEIVKAEAEGAHCVTIGPVFATPSKEGILEPIGIDGLKKICSSCRLPVMALGGIGPGDIGAIRDAGAAGVAGIRLFSGTKREDEEVFRASLSGFRVGAEDFMNRSGRPS